VLDRRGSLRVCVHAFPAPGPSDRAAPATLRVGTLLASRVIGAPLMPSPLLVLRTGPLGPRSASGRSSRAKSSGLRSCPRRLAGLVDDLGLGDFIVVDRGRTGAAVSGTVAAGRGSRRCRVEPLRELLARGDQRLVRGADRIDVGAVQRL